MNLRGLALSLISIGPGTSSNFGIPVGVVAAVAVLPDPTRITATLIRQRKALLVAAAMARLLWIAEFREPGTSEANPNTIVLSTAE
jgi:hypothetical protein